MVHERRRGRFPKLSALVAAGVLTVSACGGPDLGKENFARTTVPAASGDSSASSGPITDPAVAAAALRPVLPCQFVDRASLAALGTPDGDPVPSTVRFDDCRAKVKDPGGKEISVDVQLGGLVSFASSKGNGQVGGLPQVENTGSDDSCTLSALTSRDPDLGLSLAIDYQGGDPCRAGRTLLAAAVQKLHSAPQKYAEAQGSLIDADPCAVLSEDAVGTVVKGAKAHAVSLHSCTWGTGASVTVLFYPAGPPLEGDGWLKADVGTPNQAFRKLDPSGRSDCQVQWQHRPWLDDRVEVAQLRYTNYDARPDQDDPCGKAVGLARQLAPKLPRP
ncbi:hypothetical protein [Amycolatopsis sp. PS_44_ISF1]|uniref:hypothetical protein n=1 Tax=Amycolatopsis sp. PS_44_ISF1 TaxID=2974917 RepID=UPI0028DF8EFD|nr:hypothetical protein [Amycolatopsis sp. PS_44_ISF1]MDT8911698.1 hypothetical protein [Amycolatopsis sp. PS_44_ISF1]